MTKKKEKTMNFHTTDFPLVTNIAYHTKFKKLTAKKKETLRVINHFCKHSLFVKYELITKCNSIISTYVLS